MCYDLTILKTFEEVYTFRTWIHSRMRMGRTKRAYEPTVLVVATKRACLKMHPVTS